VRSRRNSTDAKLQRLRRELAAEPADGSIRAALIVALMRIGAWHEIAQLARAADLPRRGIKITTIGLEQGRYHTAYEIEHVVNDRAEAHGLGPDGVLNGIVAAVDAWGREPAGSSPWLPLWLEEERKAEVRDQGLYWHEILGMLELRPVLEQAGFKVVGEVSEDAVVISVHNPIVDRRAR